VQDLKSLLASACSLLGCAVREQFVLYLRCSSWISPFQILAPRPELDSVHTLSPDWVTVFEGRQCLNSYVILSEL
jgi:hypothetical protein